MSHAAGFLCGAGLHDISAFGTFFWSGNYLEGKSSSSLLNLAAGLKEKRSIAMQAPLCIFKRCGG